MSEKEKRDVTPRKKTDAVRFRDILKESEEIMKTAYPAEKETKKEASEESEIEVCDEIVEIAEREEIIPEKEVINPFTEEKLPKGKLDADFTPDGKMLIEDNPEKAKSDKKRSREQAKIKIKHARQNLKREKLLVKIKELEPKLAEVRKEKEEAEGTAEFDKLVKKERRLSNKINDLNQRAVSPKQLTASTGFYMRARNFKIWVVVLVVMVLTIITLSAMLFSYIYDDLTHFKGDSAAQRESVDRLSGEVSSLNKEKDSVSEEKSALEKKVKDLNKKVEELNKKNSDLEDQVADYKKKNEELSPKAKFLDDHIVIVNGDFWGKTYHKFGCSDLDTSSFWAYNIEQVDGKFGYEKCPKCIK